MAIKITSDSTCDLSPELLSRYDVALMPLYVQKGEETFRDGIDIHPDDIFAHVAAGGDLCKTAAGNIDDYTQLFTKYAGEYDAVVHINISAEFSSSYQNACIAAEEFENVFVIDSRNLSSGQGHGQQQVREDADGIGLGEHHAEDQIGQRAQQRHHGVTVKSHTVSLPSTQMKDRRQHGDDDQAVDGDEGEICKKAVPEGFPQKFDEKIEPP